MNSRAGSAVMTKPADGAFRVGRTTVVWSRASNVTMRRKSALGGAVTAIVTGVALLPAAASASAPKPRLSERRLTQIALKAATANGDRRPSLIQDAEATRSRANLIAGGDIVPGSAWCYLIVRVSS